MKTVNANLVLAATALLLISCNGNDSIQEAAGPKNSVVLGIPGTNPTSFAARQDAICDPLGTGLPADLEHGLRATLDIMDPSSAEQPDRLSAFDTLGATRVSKDLYFTEVNVPTRPWDSGFITQKGETIKDAQGHDAVEFFRLGFKSEIELSDNDAEGYYQFSLLSDDGSKLDIQQAGNILNLVPNDGIFPPKLACAGTVVKLEKGKRYPIDLQYFQGPRYHIALMLMWKYHGPAAVSGAALNDAGCERGGYTDGSNYWFQTTSGAPQPKQSFTNLLGRGWSTVKPVNFRLPAGTEANMCAEIPEWSEEENCKTDYYLRPAYERFNLTINPVDPARLEVIVDGARPSFTYDNQRNQVIVPGVGGVAQLVAVRSCKRVCSGPICDIIGI